LRPSQKGRALMTDDVHDPAMAEVAKPVMELTGKPDAAL
jgi:hypothetical protein